MRAHLKSHYPDGDVPSIRRKRKSHHCQAQAIVPTTQAVKRKKKVKLPSPSSVTHPALVPVSFSAPPDLFLPCLSTSPSLAPQQLPSPSSALMLPLAPIHSVQPTYGTAVVSSEWDVSSDPELDSCGVSSPLSFSPSPLSFSPSPLSFSSSPPQSLSPSPLSPSCPPTQDSLHDDALPPLTHFPSQTVQSHLSLLDQQLAIDIHPPHHHHHEHQEEVANFAHDHEMTFHPVGV